MEIEEIRDIIRFASTYYSGDIGPLDLKNLSVEDSKLASFYKMLKDTKIQKDEDAADLIYGTPKLDTKYMFLKSNFTARALNSIASLDLLQPEISEYTRAVNKSYKQLFILSILLRLGSRKGAISLAKKTLRLSEKFELHHVSVELLEKLRSHALQNGKRTEYEKYLKRLEWELAVLASESKVKTLEERLLIHSARSLYIDETLQEQARIALVEMEQELAKYDTFMIRMASFRMQYMYYQLTGNPLRSVIACNNAISYMQGMPHMTLPTSIGEFELYKLENYILARDYENGKQTAHTCSSYFTSGTNNWFLYKGYEFILLMHTLKFEEANSVYHEVTTHGRFHSQPAHLRERWDIFRFYLDYVLDIHDQGTGGHPPRQSSLLRQTKYKKKIGEFPTYSADKRGFNVSILMMNILLLLENNKIDQLLEQVEALSTYRFSHLKGKNSHQSAILFRLILMMVRSDFDPVKMKKNAPPLEKKLSSTRPSPTEIFECVQVLPPEWIWARMKAALE
ncbi:MAG: hypothetical protein ACHQM6_11100, partial [Candidatus Kapaibacterium sp.]